MWNVENKPREPTDVEEIRETVILETSKGKIRGFVSQSPKGQTLLNFRGIPYAKPPIGELRFKHPEEMNCWEPKIKDCFYFGSRCLQRTSYGVELPLVPIWWRLYKDTQSYLFGWGKNEDINDPEPQDPNQSEDCLTLNVCTPDTEAKLPVIVFIHGGGFTLGHSGEQLYAQQWGTPLADHNCVFVSFNYRLGMFGYLKVEGGDYNNGLADQIAALTWVKNEIHKFGGDPACITISGHSAGAMSVASILACPKAKGLFQRAILMSGAAFNAISKEEADVVSGIASKVLGTKLSKQNLARFTSTQILAAQNYMRDKPNPMPFQPVVDGDLFFKNLYIQRDCTVVLQCKWVRN